MLGKWETRYDHNYIAPWPRGWLTLSWKVEECYEPRLEKIRRFRQGLIEIKIGSIGWRVLVAFEKLSKPSVDLTIRVTRRTWAMFRYPDPRCHVHILRWSWWAKLGLSLDQANALAYKSLNGIHHDESVRFLVKGPKAMPYEYGVYYLRGLCYVGGLHCEWGIIRDKAEEQPIVQPDLTN